MRRSELAEAVMRINQSLIDSHLIEVMQDLFKQDQSTRDKSGEFVYTDLLEAFHRFSISAHDFGKTEFEVLDILNLSVLNQPGTWGKMLVPQAFLKTNLPFQLHSHITFALEYLPRLLKLIEQQYVSSFKYHPDQVPEQLRGKSIISVMILEEQYVFSKPTRITDVLESIANLYEVQAILLNNTPDDLGVIACDSGSDKSFDFLGAAKVIEGVKDLILSVWDRVVFYRERKLSERIDLIAKSLPIIEHIGGLLLIGVEN